MMNEFAIYKNEITLRLETLIALNYLFLHIFVKLN